MNMICRCGPRSRAPMRAHVIDARPHSSARGSDPTGTMPLQRRFQRDLAARWDTLRRTVPNFVTARTDLATTIGHAAITGQDPVRAFQKWFDTALKMVVVGDGRWMARYVREAGDAALMRAGTLTQVKDADAAIVDAAPPRDRIPPLQTLCHAELQGIAEAVSQQAVRTFANGLLTRQSPSQIARDVQQIIDSVGKPRSDMLVSFIVVRAFGATTLDAFRASGVTHVGTVAERAGASTAPPSVLARDAVFPSRKVTRAENKLRRKYAETEVDVQTAEDDRVCPECEEISAGGPYTLDEAEGLIPAHPRCRCSFVPADDSVNDAFNPDEPRNDKGKWTTGGAIQFKAPEDDNDFWGETPATPKDKQRYKAISWYQANGYKPINNALRQGTPLGENMKKTVSAIDELIASSRTTKDLTVYRGAGVNKKIDVEMFEKAVGKTVALKGYTSTTASKSIANGFGDGDDHMVFRIDVPKGARALEIKGEEKELLLPRNAKFRVKDVKRGNDTKALDRLENDLDRAYAKEERTYNNPKEHAAVKNEVKRLEKERTKLERLSYKPHVVTMELVQ